MGVGPTSFFYIYFFCFIVFYMQEIYIQNKKMLEISKNLPECHCIGKRLKYPRISRKIMKMPLAAHAAHARLLLEAANFSGEISSQ